LGRLLSTPVAAWVVEGLLQRSMGVSSVIGGTIVWILCGDLSSVILCSLLSNVSDGEVYTGGVVARKIIFYRCFSAFPSSRINNGYVILRMIGCVCLACCLWVLHLWMALILAVNFIAIGSSQDVERRIVFKCNGPCVGR
jgi:hypothetical protein